MNIELPQTRKRIFGKVEIDCLSRDDLVFLCKNDLKKESFPSRIVTDANGHGISLANSNEEFRNHLKNSDIVHADGGYLITLSKILPGEIIPERSATTDMIHDFSSAFSGTDVSFYLFGGTEEVNRMCASKLKEKYHEINIVGRRNGYFSDDQFEDIVNEICRLKPKIIWLGLGKPFEQIIAQKLKGRTNSCWIITCGGCFNYITGHYSRSPLWMQNMNLEWLYRMISNPRKLFWRYLVTTPHALWVSLRNFS